MAYSHARATSALLRRFSACSASRTELKNAAAIDSFLSKSSWSVRSLLPTDASLATMNEVRPEQLRHLLRLSALEAPQPNSEEESKMLRDLHSQLHFVRQVQAVDTQDVEPLASLRNESADARRENEIGLDAMKDALDAEEVIGRYYKRIRRKTVDDTDARAAEAWNVTGQANRKLGKYFVVENQENSTT